MINPHAREQPVIAREASGRGPKARDPDPPGRWELEDMPSNQKREQESSADTHRGLREVVFVKEGHENPSVSSAQAVFFLYIAYPAIASITMIRRAIATYMTMLPSESSAVSAM